MPLPDSLQSASSFLKLQKGPEPEELTKGKEDLIKIIEILEAKEKEIEASADPAERKSERYAKIAEVLKAQVLPVLQSWLTKYPEKKEGITKAIAQIEALITKYEKKSAELKKSTEKLKEASKETAPVIPDPNALRAQKEAFWKEVLTARKAGSSWLEEEPPPFKKLVSPKWNKDRLARALTNGIKELDEDTARILVEYKLPGQTLCLDGLSEISPKVLSILVADGGNSLSLNGLTELTPELMEILGKSENNIFLLEVKYDKLDEKTKKKVAEAKCYSIHFKEGTYCENMEYGEYWYMEGRTARLAEQQYKESERKNFIEFPPELAPLKSRFDQIPASHPGLKWTVELRDALVAKKDIIEALESAGHEPTVLKMGDEIYIVSGATETPASTKNKNYAEAVGAATTLGVTLMSEAQYRAINPSMKQLDVGGFTWWLQAPEDILKSGYALVGSLHEGAVRVLQPDAGFRNSILGWRASLRIDMGKTNELPKEKPAEKP